MVVGGRESRPQGEAGQVDRNDKERGRRDVERRPPENPATGEPCAVKVASPLRRGAEGKARGRLPARAYELRHRTYLASRLPYRPLIPIGASASPSGDRL